MPIRPSRGRKAYGCKKLFNKHYSQTKISGPDFVKVAEAYGAKGFRITKVKDYDGKNINEQLWEESAMTKDEILELLDTVAEEIKGGL